MEQEFSEFSEFSDKSMKRDLVSVSRFCLPHVSSGTVVAPWFLTQEVAGLNPFTVIVKGLNNRLKFLKFWPNRVKQPIG